MIFVASLKVHEHGSVCATSEVTIYPLYYHCLSISPQGFMTLTASLSGCMISTLTNMGRHKYQRQIKKPLNSANGPIMYNMCIFQ